jgi:hypothetical protein
MSIRRHRCPSTVAIVVLVFAVPVLTHLLGPGVVLGQERDTGRHKPVVEEPVLVVEDGQKATPDRETLPRQWHLGLEFGLQGASDLFRVEALDGFSPQWESIGGGGFNASRFTATFDQDFSLGLFFQKDMGEMWALRAEVGVSRMDVIAEALSGQTGELYLYERVDMVNLGVGAEFRLTRAPSYPFAGIAILVSSLSPATFDDLAQTNLGGRLSLGYLQKITPELALRLEGRVGLTALDVDDYHPPSEPAVEVDYDSESTLRIFELLLAIQASFGG